MARTLYSRLLEALAPLRETQRKGGKEAEQPYQSTSEKDTNQRWAGYIKEQPLLFLNKMNFSTHVFISPLLWRNWRVL
jgi:hypothetical protein